MPFMMFGISEAGKQDLNKLSPLLYYLKYLTTIGIPLQPTNRFLQDYINYKTQLSASIG